MAIIWAICLSMISVLRGIDARSATALPVIGELAFKRFSIEDRTCSINANPVSLGAFSTGSAITMLAQNTSCNDRPKASAYRAYAGKVPPYDENFASSIPAIMVSEQPSLCASSGHVCFDCNRWFIRKTPRRAMASPDLVSQSVGVKRNSISWTARFVLRRSSAVSKVALVCKKSTWQLGHRPTSNGARNMGSLSPQLGHVSTNWQSCSKHPNTFVKRQIKQ